MPYDDDEGQAGDFGQANPSSNAAGDKERVGYKQPPKHSRYRKGQSGNPAGRPKGSLNKSTVRALVAAQWLEETIKIVEGGRERRVPRLVALLKKQAELALKGDLRAMKDVFDLVLRLAVEEATLRTSEETTTEDEAILRNHWPSVLDADERDASPCG
ncbi:DUF5681 domain-containing protein [Methylobacterium sp. E-065]|uniref:DUF5681 domain-containing protein n=1 Tax=Methylobacterium sp. E-065 TaxID=2836583 RepID=UPI001FBA29ED|nr:DUF5681 domain-containing protein [Methylobacterium sp. E-065]MCJ2022352.1 DUF5681 domain-containing protein [Methylobacterium sp. E-065]